MAGLVDIDLGGVIAAGGNLLDDLFTSDEEKLALGIQEKQIDAGLRTGQMETNKVEASHKSIFVAGWRPFMDGSVVCVGIQVFILSNAGLDMASRKGIRLDTKNIRDAPRY